MRVDGRHSPNFADHCAYAPFMNEPNRIPKPVMMALAAVFLFETWIWEACVALGRQLAELLPWDELKSSVRRGIDGLPPPAALLVFLIPVAIVEPLKIFCLGLFAHHHYVLGVVGFIALKFIGFGLIAFVFDLTRDKLLSMPWFVVVYDKLMAFHAYAHDLMAPAKAALLAAMREWRERLRPAAERLRALAGLARS